MINQQQVDAATRRFAEREQQRKRNEQLIRDKRFLEVDTPERIAQFVRRRAGARTGEEVAPPEVTTSAPGRAQPLSVTALERMMGTSDLMGVAFLERGLQVARSVGRIWVSVASGKPVAFGTGFLVTPRLLLTNNHVLPDAGVARNSLVEFDYQIGVDGAPSPTCSFALDPDLFFVTDEALDFSLIGVAELGTPQRSITDYIWNRLIESQGKVILGQWMNIVQHPNGEPKQLALRENQLVDLLDDFLQYKTDTAPGSSGSPVYNDRWEVVGLHHSGVWETDSAGRILAVDGSIWREEMGDYRIKWKANEGVRISRIVAHVRAQALTPDQRRLFNTYLAEGGPVVPNRPEPQRGGEAPAPEEVQGQVSSDGTVSVTIPFTVSLRLGCVASTMASADTPGPGAPAVKAPSSISGGAASSHSEVLAAARRELQPRADVLSVKLGYLFRNGWITNERAIVVTVRDKLSPTALKQSGIAPLPDTFMGLPIDVTSPSLVDLFLTTRGGPSAREVMSTRAVTPEEITYTSPPSGILKKTTAPMRVCAHVSPDAGWPQLQAFIGATRKTLTVAMYDFGAPHIEKAVQDLAAKPKMRTTLVMQRGENVGTGTKADDLTDAEVVERLGDAFGARFENAWVKIGRVNGWVSSSYHIKVAVRDSEAFWLSSGNWQSSNQPDADPLAEEPQSRSWLNKYNRDWHVIIEHPGLAQECEKYIKHDFANNQATPDEAVALLDLLVPAGFLMPLEAARPFTYFAPKDETRQFTVTPLLTPDNYHEQVLNLVRGAQSELLIQNQTFKAPGDGHEKLKKLIDAAMERIDAGVDVRVIFRVLMATDARETLTALKDYGFPTDCMKVQKNCHTKGIIVDGERVLIGSQNWSNDGVSVNRDASLLFEDAPLAQYFRKIFEHDWQYQADRNIGAERGGVRVASRDEATPPGMLRLSWKDYMEMQ